jgi:hypothetical protein
MSKRHRGAYTSLASNVKPSWGYLEITSTITAMTKMRIFCSGFIHVNLFELQCWSWWTLNYFVTNPLFMITFSGRYKSQLRAYISACYNYNMSVSMNRDILESSTAQGWIAWINQHMLQYAPIHRQNQFLYLFHLVVRQG